MRNIKYLILFLSISIIFSSCEFMFGSKYNDEVEDIFEQGKIDPNLAPQNVGYVPILPIWNEFSNPVDVFVGYDEMIYVVDDNGLHILDLKGKLHRTINIYKAKEVTQDRRIHTYVIGKAIVEISGEPKELTAVYHLKNTSTKEGAVFIDTLIHPFCDVSRNTISFRNEDLNVEFTGIATRADNVLYVSRKGNINDLSSSARPDNAILIFDEEGKNIAYANGLNPITPNLKSVIGISSIATFAGPPQKIFGMNETHDFLICQADQNVDVEFRVLWIMEFFDPDAGTQYIENANMLQKDYSKADGFLYGSHKFSMPEDVCIAPDQSGYIFVVDSENDYFYQFTSKGFEGVEPPPNSSETKNINVSFGGKGTGPFQFDNPTGVCYYRKTIYIADKGNNRILRYRLNTDLE